MDDVGAWPLPTHKRFETLARKAQVARQASVQARAQARQIVAESQQLRGVAQALLVALKHQLRP